MTAAISTTQQGGFMTDEVTTAEKPLDAVVKRTKPAKKKVAKPKAKNKPKPKPKAKKAAAVVTRPERLDLRLTKGEKAKLSAKAKATRRTITSVVQELIEKMK